jgi:CRP-like cAMP-binding protein
MTLSTIERVLLLKGVDLFSRIAGEDLVAVAEAAREVHLDVGETFIRQGAAGDCLYLLVDGEVGIVLPGVGRVAVCRSPASIGEMAIITRQPRSADCVTLTEVTALRIDRDDFSDLLADQPSVALGIIEVLAQRLTNAMETIQQLKGTAD